MGHSPSSIRQKEKSSSVVMFVLLDFRNNTGSIGEVINWEGGGV